MFRANPARGHVIPHGLDAAAMAELAQTQGEEDYLVSAATIHPRKNSVMLAQAAHLAGVPVVFLGKPYAPNDPYFWNFRSTLIIKWCVIRGLFRRKRSMVICAGREVLCCSANVRAEASRFMKRRRRDCRCSFPICPGRTKLYRQARNTSFVSLKSAEKVAPALKAFYAQAHRQPGTTFPLLTWRQVAERYVEIYRELLARS